jgi:hypothetical protein
VRRVALRLATATMLGLAGEVEDFGFVPVGADLGDRDPVAGAGGGVDRGAHGDRPRSRPVGGWRVCWISASTPMGSRCCWVAVQSSEAMTAVVPPRSRAAASSQASSCCTGHDRVRADRPVPAVQRSDLGRVRPTSRTPVGSPPRSASGRTRALRSTRRLDGDTWRAGRSGARAPLRHPWSA